MPTMIDRACQNANLGSRIVSTNVAPEQSFATRASEDQRRSEVWRTVVDRPLIDWGRDSAQLQEDGMIPPSSGTIGRACQVARVLYDAGWVAPEKVVPTGDGGIKFERWDGSSYQAIEILPEGSVELSTFKNGKLVLCKPLEIDFS